MVLFTGAIMLLAYIAEHDSNKVVHIHANGAVKVILGRSVKIICCDPTTVNHQICFLYRSFSFCTASRFSTASAPI